MNDIHTIYQALTSVKISKPDIKPELTDEILYYPYTNPNNFAKVGFPKVDPANGHEYVDLGLSSGTL